MLKKTVITLVLSFALILLLVSSVAITAEAPELTASTQHGKIHKWQGPVPKGVVWDNGMDYVGLAASQQDNAVPFDAIEADDFIFDVDQPVNDIHWVGGYWVEGEPPYDGNFDWEIKFYNDFGDGTKPGATITTYTFSNADVNETLIESTSIYFCSYSVDLPAPLSFGAGTKYWISIQGIGDYPPQSGWAYHQDPILLHQAVFKSVYFGYPDWTNTEDVFGYPIDMCFQLTYTEEEWPNHKMHFPQLPDLEGWDVYALFPKTLADDWQCSATGEVLDIHFWGSWKDTDGDPYTDDFYTPMPWFGLSIHRNIPADADTPYSRPGEMLWWWDGEIEGIPFEPPAMEHWFNPNTGEVLYNDHVPYWRYDFFFDQASPPPEPFFQYEDSIYWLNIAVEPSTSPPPYEWGWKSSRDHFMDDATYTDNPPDGPWFPLYEPPRANWFDVYFNSAGDPDDMGSTNYYGGGWYRYEYWWNMWFYNNPFVLNPKHIWLDFNIDPVGPEPYVEFAINWSTDLWYYEGEPGRPPLPGDDETLYIGRQVFPVDFGPNTIDFWIDDYNPEWVSIDFVATDVVINGWIWHECVQTSMDLAFVITGEEEPCDPPNINCPDDETQNQNGVYTTTTQWTADDGNPGDPNVWLTSVAVDLAMLPPGISAANVNFTGCVPGPGCKSTNGTVTYTVNDHCQSGGPIYLDATNNCPPPNTATCSFNVDLTNDPPDITQPDSLEGYVNDVVEYDITGDDPNGDIINDGASIQIEPDCGTYSITRTSGSGTSSGTWHVSWNTSGCTACITHLVIHDLTDTCGATAYCTTKVHLSEEVGWHWKDPYPNYAPNGMPDIDQRQDTWIKFETEQWSFCGPVAVANCFKWFDSKYEFLLGPPPPPCPVPGFPGDGCDMFPLVRDYLDELPPLLGWDDHDPWNVDHVATGWNPGIGPPPPTPQPFVPGPQPPNQVPPWGELVERLAWYFDTDGIQTEYCNHTGTDVMWMQEGIQMWFESEMFEDGSTLADTLCEVTTARPTFAYVESLVEKCEDVILLLGFWFEDPPGSGEWWRVGGHYVTVAGVNSEELLIAFSDPFIDAFEMGMAPGRVGDGDYIPHPHGSHDPTIHNDEGNVCHDIYMVDTLPISPGGLWWLPEYAIMIDDPFYWTWNFYNQNVPEEFQDLTSPWNEVSPIFTEVEYCVHISPWDYRGDANGDGKIDVVDVVFLINYLFNGTSPPDPYSQGDVNCDGKVDVSDVVRLINYLFGGASAPRCCDP